MAETETSIIVILDGHPVARCVAHDVAVATVEGILNKISNNPNYTITIQKQTVNFPDPKPEESKEEVKPEVADIKKEEK